MKLLIPIFLFLSSSLLGSYFDIDIQRTNNYQFQENFFLDIDTKNAYVNDGGRKVGVEAHKKKISGYQLNADLRITEIAGLKTHYINFFGPTNVMLNTAYIGSAKTIYFSYGKGKQHVHYFDGEFRDSQNTYDRFSVFDVLSYERHHFSSKKVEDYTLFDVNSSSNIAGNDLITRKYTKEIWKLSTEDLIREVKYNAYNTDEFFLWYGAGKTYKDNIKLYGLLIASYEYHDYTDGEAYDTERRNVKVEWGGSSLDPADPDIFEKVQGKYKGYGYGYDLTAEYVVDNFSFFINLYYKTTKLRNYHTDILHFEEPEVDPETGDSDDPVYEEGVIRKKKIVLHNKTTNFGIRYRF